MGSSDAAAAAGFMAAMGQQQQRHQQQQQHQEDQTNNGAGANMGKDFSCAFQSQLLGFTWFHLQAKKIRLKHCHENTQKYCTRELNSLLSKSTIHIISSQHTLWSQPCFANQEKSIHESYLLEVLIMIVKSLMWFILGGQKSRKNQNSINILLNIKIGLKIEMTVLSFPGSLSSYPPPAYQAHC